MVTRIQYRALLVPLLIYTVSGAAFYYFVWTAANGDRGLKAKTAYKAEIINLSKELDLLKAEHTELERRKDQLRSATIDSDLLEEQARIRLGRVAKNDVVIFLGKSGTN
jgi:cell division protein FtsB